MFNSKRENLNKIAIFTIAILLALATIINISLAYFTDSASTKGGGSSGEIRLGTIAIKVSVAGENYVVENGKVKFTLTADEVTQSEVYRTIILENADGKKTEDFAMRMASNSNSSKVIAGVSSKETEYVDSADLISDNWLTGTDNKSYFTKFVHLPEGKKVYIPVVIKMNNLSSSDFTSSLYVTFDIEVIQAANDGYKSWETKPASLNITETYTPLNEYTQLEYIESTGTQYIDTGYVPNENTRLNIQFAVNEANTKVDCPLFGTRTSGSRNSYTFWCHGVGFSGGNSQIIFNDTVNYVGYFDLNKKYTVSIQNGSYSINGTQTTFSKVSSGTPTGANLILFALNTGGSVDSRRFAGLLYSFRIYDNNTLVCNFIPSQNSSGAVGLYDTVTKTFYGNAGTGTFVAGPAV